MLQRNALDNGESLELLESGLNLPEWSVFLLLLGASTKLVLKLL